VLTVFFKCCSLSSLAFDPGSKLAEIGSHALYHSEVLESICIPSSVEVLSSEFFRGWYSLLSLTFESGSKLTRIESKTFCDCKCVKSICIPSSVEVLCSECFRCCSSLSSLTFESNSQLNRIENEAFAWCTSLKSICIPGSIRELQNNWNLQSSLRNVIFESDSPEHIGQMMRHGKFDLVGNVQRDNESDRTIVSRELD
jgi:hypothetical protein